MRFALALFCMLTCSCAGAQDALTVLDSETTNSSTFQSHDNRHVVVDDDLFVVYLRTYAANSMAQTWRVARENQISGQITTLREATNATSTPCIDRDAAGNLYVVLSDWGVNKVFFYRFDRASGFALAVSTQYDVSGRIGSFKFTCAFDLSRGHFVYFGNAGFLITFATSGAVLSDVTVQVSSATNWVQYPHIFIEPTGRINLAWTYADRTHAWWYTGVGYIYSDDAVTWRKSVAQSVTLPVVCDDPVATVNVVSQNGTPTNRLLTSMLPLNGLVHFAYTENGFIDDPASVFTNPTGNLTRYVHYNPLTGVLSSPVLLGDEQQANSIDGALVPDLSGTLFYVADTAGVSMSVFATQNSGASWILVKSLLLPGGTCPYAVGALRSLYMGHILGTLTIRDGRTCTGPTAPAQTWQFTFAVGR